MVDAEALDTHDGRLVKQQVVQVGIRERLLAHLREALDDGVEVGGHRDRDVDDGGSSSGGDSLDLYCINGSLRMCLSGEACPWRAGAPAVDDGRSCSTAGLSSGGMYMSIPLDFMAYLNNGYLQIAGHRYNYVYCSTTGHLIFDLH